MVTTRPDTESKSHRQTWRRCCHVCGQSTGEFAVSSPQRTDRITGSDRFSKQMLTHHSCRHLVDVMDQAPPHTSKKTISYIESQKRLHVFHLLKYSPDWNPDEKVWNHLKHQELTRHQARTKEELPKLARRILQSMARRPSLMRGIFFRCCVAELFG